MEYKPDYEKLYHLMNQSKAREQYQLEEAISAAFVLFNRIKKLGLGKDFFEVFLCSDLIDDLCDLKDTYIELDKEIEKEVVEGGSDGV